MAHSIKNAFLLILNIDGLRKDALINALRSARAPTLSKLLGGWQASHGIHLDPVSPAPSVTFTSQSTIFTGLHPDQHGVAGNQFFDRFGVTSNGRPRFYAFDVGDTLAVKDAVGIFRGRGLLNQILPPHHPTLYEIAARNGYVSTVVYNMVSRGADTWIRPDLVQLARLTKGGGLLGISAEAYDLQMVEKAITHLQQGNRPDVLSVYFMGLDHASHEFGPDIQASYLESVIDNYLLKLMTSLENMKLTDNLLTIVVSDHGQISVINDDRHSLRMAFPFDREMGYLFDALHLDVHDYPGETPNCDAVVACNGGMAHVYLRDPSGSWAAPPNYQRDVLPVARAFWKANLDGNYAQDLQNSLRKILVRDVQSGGWDASYQVYTPDGIQPLTTLEGAELNLGFVEPVHRIENLSGPMSGDLLLISNYHDGFYYGAPLRGVHGGLDIQDSLPALSISWLGSTAAQLRYFRKKVRLFLRGRKVQEGRQMESLADLTPLITKLYGWK